MKKSILMMIFNNQIKYIGDDSLRPDKLICFPALTVVIRYVFKQGDLFYQIYLDDYINYKRNLLFKMISYKKITGYNNKKEGVQCMICNHYYFKDNFNYQPYVCNKCHDFSMTVIILNVKNNDYRVYISNIDKKEAIIIFKKI